MDGGDFAGLRRQSEGFGCDLEKPRGLAEIEPGLDPVISRLEHRNAVMRAQRCDALPRPAVAVTSDKAIPAVITSAEALLRWPRRRLGKRIWLCTPPIQWTINTISPAS